MKCHDEEKYKIRDGLTTDQTNPNDWRMDVNVIKFLNTHLMIKTITFRSLLVFSFQKKLGFIVVNIILCIMN